MPLISGRLHWIVICEADGFSPGENFDNLFGDWDEVNTPGGGWGWVEQPKH